MIQQFGAAAYLPGISPKLTPHEKHLNLKYNELQKIKVEILQTALFFT